VPTNYSYCSSELNWTFHEAQSFHPFATVLPSLLRTKWYFACLLELFFKSRRSNLAFDPLYPAFTVYFCISEDIRDYRHPHIATLGEPCTLIIFFKELDCLIKHRVFHYLKSGKSNPMLGFSHNLLR